MNQPPQIRDQDSQRDGEGHSAFLEFSGGDLAKVNSERRAQSQPDIWIIPNLDKSSVQFVSAAEMQHQPCSCYNCHEYNERAATCQLIGPAIRVEKFVYGEPDLPIEYWPSCGAHLFGEPNKEEAKYKEQPISPDHLGLAWINAPKPGQKVGGANCGGCNGGDDCDYWMIDGSNGEDKLDYDTAFCQVLQENTECGDVCAAWLDDDVLSWQLAQNIFRAGQAKVSPQGQTDEENVRMGFRRIGHKEESGQNQSPKTTGKENENG